MGENDCCQAEAPNMVLGPRQPEEVGNAKHGYDTKITALDHGYHVHIGCMRFAVEQIETLVKFLEMYYKNPQETEKLFREGKLFT